MGQYHVVGSLTKGEALYSNLFGSGAKLLEQGADGFGGPTTALAMFLVPKGRWHSDQIAVVGDYAEPGDLPADVPFADDPLAFYYIADRDGYAVSYVARRLISEAFGVEYINNGYVERKVDIRRLKALANNKRDDGLFIVNHSKRQMIDPVAFGCGRNLPSIALISCGVMMALLFLLAVSNGRGGGDFPVTTEHTYVGSWGGCSIAIDQAVDGYRDISEYVTAELISMNDDMRLPLHIEAAK